MSGSCSSGLYGRRLPASDLALEAFYQSGLHERYFDHAELLEQVLLAVGFEQLYTSDLSVTTPSDTRGY